MSKGSLNTGTRLPIISVPVLALFRYIARGYFRRNFHAVRVSRQERFTHFARETGPLLVYANHSSWWDPMVSTLLADRLMRGRKHYAPMDADALERYGILKKIGVFGVEMKTARGAVRFLRVGETVLASSGVLWITPQGRFVDARDRPLEFKPGLAALAARSAAEHGSCTVLPLAIEYPFWDERLPECLLHFAEAVIVRPSDKAEQVQERLRIELETGMDELRRLASARDAGPFTTLAQGSVGTGGFYSIGQRVMSLMRGQRYRPEHTLVPDERKGEGTRDLAKIDEPNSLRATPAAEAAGRQE